MMADLQT